MLPPGPEKPCVDELFEPLRRTERPGMRRASIDTVENEILQGCFEEGQKACEAGVSRDKNPYTHVAPSLACSRGWLSRHEQMTQDYLRGVTGPTRPVSVERMLAHVGCGSLDEMGECQVCDAIRDTLKARGDELQLLRARIRFLEGDR